jgi:hypothetical protein
MDASSKTPTRPDGSGGRCLNDLVAKGPVESLNLVRLVLKCVMGRHAVTGDISQFYNSLKLKEEYFNLQRFLWRMNLDEMDETLQAVIVTLMYGVKSVSAQSEEAMIRLARDFQTLYPALADLLLTGRYVDDMAASMATMEELKQLVRDAEMVFREMNISCKEWTFSGEDPPEAVSGGEPSVEAAGLTWLPKTDVICEAIPRLHFGCVCHGRVDEVGSPCWMDSCRASSP